MVTTVELSYPDESYLMVRCQLGHMPLDFVVDTGSMVTIVSLETVRLAGLISCIEQNVNLRLSLEPNEYTPSILGQLRVPLLVGLVVVEPFIAVMNCSPVSILGMDVLTHYGCKLDLPPRLTFTLSPITEATERELVMLPCQLFTTFSEIHETEALLDTGCSSAAVLPLRLAVSMGLRHLIEPDGTTAMTITGTATCIGIIKNVILCVMNRVIQLDMQVYEKFVTLIIGLPGLIKLRCNLKFTSP